MSLSRKAIFEIQQLSSRSEELARGSASQRKEAEILQKRIDSIHKTGMSSDEMRAGYCETLVESISPKEADAEKRYVEAFHAYLRGDDTKLRKFIERRDFLVGTTSISYTESAAGGVMVPFSYDGILREAETQSDDIFGAASFSMTPGPTLQPEQISGYDLSTISAQLIGEATQQNPQTIPTVLGATLKNNLIFKASFAASWEAEEDIPSFAEKITRAAAVALFRKIGQSVISGRGGTDINGIVASMGGASQNNTAAGTISLTDILSFYFAVNRWYRAQPKCGWLVTDSVYKMLRAATDYDLRPLLNVERDTETLLGKPIFICPSLATAFSSIGLKGSLIFGDLASIVIRASRPTITRNLESGQSDITKGEALWIGRCRADAAYFDPSGGSAPPLMMAAIS
jgi:HK97 family phage major capsid protein